MGRNGITIVANYDCYSLFVNLVDVYSPSSLTFRNSVSITVLYCLVDSIPDIIRVGDIESRVPVKVISMSLQDMFKPARRVTALEPLHAPAILELVGTFHDRADLVHVAISRDVD